MSVILLRYQEYTSAMLADSPLLTMPDRLDIWLSNDYLLLIEKGALLPLAIRTLEVCWSRNTEIQLY